MWTGLHVKCPLFLSGFNETGIFSADLKKKIHISNFTKIRPVGAELLHAIGRAGGRACGRTDVTKLIVAFRNSANAPKKKKLGSKYTYRPNVLLRRTLNCTSCTIPTCSHESIFLPTCLHLPQMFAHYTMLLLLLRPVITFYSTHYYDLCLRWLCKICHLYITSNLHLLEIFCNRWLESIFDA